MLALFKNDSTYKTTLTLNDKNKLKAIWTYINFFKSDIGIKRLIDMKDHFECIRNVYSIRGKWFEKEYQVAKEHYVDKIIKLIHIEKTKDQHNQKEKAIYIYSTSALHAFLLLNTLEVIEVNKKFVDFKREEFGSYYTVRFDSYGEVEVVTPRLKLDDMLDL